MVRRYDKAHFICYSNAAEPFRTNGNDYCASALKAGFDTATHYTEEDLRKTDFWAENAEILEQERGAGYWLWKPYILLNKLRQVGPNDIVVYNDVGRFSPGSFHPFPRFPQAAINMAAITPQRFLHGFITDWLIQGHYTKRDCFIGLGADEPDMHFAAQVSACPLYYMPSPQAFAFLETWLGHAKDPHMLTDLPDEKAETHADFKDHRHDMAIASILIHQTKAAYVDLSKTGGHAFAEDIRRRNRDVARAQTHAGYMSLMIERALPDDYFMRDDPDLAAATGIIRNLTPDDPMPVHEQKPSRTALAGDFEDMLRNNRIAIGPEHLTAALGDNRIFAAKMHALTKLPEEESALFWKVATDHVNSTDTKGQTILTLAVTAFAHAETMLPDTRRTMLAHFIWGALSDDARDLFKSAHRNVKSTRGTEAMLSFIDTIGPDMILSQDDSLAGRQQDQSAKISELITQWLVGAEVES